MPKLIPEKYDLDNLDLIPLMFQTGYLTVKEKNIRNGDMLLDYPNLNRRRKKQTQGNQIIRTLFSRRYPFDVQILRYVC
jgi:hypothetical protein